MRILCIGDIAISDNINSIWLPPGGIVLGDEVRILLNWELPIGTTINPIPRTSGSRLLSLPDSVNIIQKWAPGFAALATNHILDAGEDGLADTIAALHQAGFQTVGAGQSADEIQQPLLWETEEGCLAIVNWVFPETNPDWMIIPGPNCWPGINEAKRIIQDLKREVDWVMLFAHWSDELFPYPRPEDRMIARELVRMGADIIVGHHPHVVRGMEIINGKPVFYSLGNFYFPNVQDQHGNLIIRQAPRNREALAVNVIFEQGQIPRFNVLSYWQGTNESKPDPYHRAVRRLRLVSKQLVKHTGDNYTRWYRKSRRTFNCVEYRIVSHSGRKDGRVCFGTIYLPRQDDNEQ